MPDYSLEALGGKVAKKLLTPSGTACLQVLDLLLLTPLFSSQTSCLHAQSVGISQACPLSPCLFSSVMTVLVSVADEALQRHPANGNMLGGRRSPRSVSQAVWQPNHNNHNNHYQGDKPDKGMPAAKRPTDKGGSGRRQGSGQAGSAMPSGPQLPSWPLPAPLPTPLVWALFQPLAADSTKMGIFKGGLGVS